MSWLVDGRTFARKVKNPTDVACRHSGRGTTVECPACGYSFDQNDVTPEWPGLPAGVKFDPSDQELLEHLAAKVGLNKEKPHPLIDEFIPTLDGEDGICYTHPEKLPGVRRDGTGIHFFHRPARAYTTGTRKRRKIQSDDDSRIGGEVRWHKTGKTRPVVENGNQLGCKKIMVLYMSSGKKSKPDKTNWVMHQYHLGVNEEERDGELVVSKIFHQTQPRQFVGMHKGDEGNPEQVDYEPAEGPAYSVPQSSTSILTTSATSRGMPPTPRTPVPFQPQAVKPQKGLYEIISKDVDRLNASLSGNPRYASHSQEQSPLPFEYSSSAIECRSGCSEQTAALELVQENPELREMDTCCSFGEKVVQTERKSHPVDEQVIGLEGLQADQLCDVPALGSQQLSDSLDADMIKLLCGENLQAVLKAKSKDDGAQSFKSFAAEMGFRMNSNVGEEIIPKTDCSLENIVLDTPPDFLLESLMTSQETLDWLGKRKFWSDSQKMSGSDDINTFDFLRDSQSST